MQYMLLDHPKGKWLMSLRIIKLSFNGPVHFGTKRLGGSDFSIKSDTLFSALFIEALNLGVSTKFLLEDLLISDTFPFKDNTMFLIKPMIQIESKNQNLTDKKAFKDLKYIPVDMYVPYINGECDGEDVKDFKDWLDIGYSTTLTKVALESMEAISQKESQPYNVGIHTFSNNSGLYFIAKGDAESLNKLELVLESLQFSGIGGKRSSGYGRFTYEVVNDSDLESLLKNKGNQKILLSTAMVHEQESLEIILEEANYLLRKRSGFVQSTTYRNTIVKKNDFYSFAAGSVFKKTFLGDIFNVGNQGKHPVYRYAKALWLEV